MSLEYFFLRIHNLIFHSIMKLVKFCFNSATRFLLTTKLQEENCFWLPFYTKNYFWKNHLFMLETVKKRLQSDKSRHAVQEP